MDTENNYVYMKTSEEESSKPWEDVADDFKNRNFEYTRQKNILHPEKISGRLSITFLMKRI